MRFHFPNEEELFWEGYNSSHPNLLISKLKTNKILSKGLLCHIVTVSDLDHDVSSIDLVPGVNDFPDLILDDLLRVPPPQEIDFDIKIEPDTKKYQLLLTE